MLSNNPHIHFLTPGNNLSPDHLRHDRLASNRLRLFPAALAATDCGAKASFGDLVPSSATHVVVGKMVKAGYERRKPLWLDQICDASATGKPILLDYTDHHLISGSDITPFYREVMQVPDAFSVPTEHLRQTLAQASDFSSNVFVVEEPTEVPFLAPADPIELYRRNSAVWFGHGSNFPFLLDYLAKWPNDAPDNLHIVSSSSVLELMQTLAIAAPRTVNIEFYLWNVNAVANVAENASVAIIPSSLNSHKAYASPNRLITSLTLGIPTLASNLPSYSEFEDYFFSLDSHEATEVFKNLESGISKVRGFQNRFRSRFTLKTIVGAWKDIFFRLGV